MDQDILVKLLQLHFEHNRKIEVFKGKINLEYFGIDLLSVVLDAVGVPADNTIEQIEKYGHVDWLIQPDTFSRYGYYRVFEKHVVSGTYEEYRAYLEAVKATTPPFYLFDLKSAKLNNSFQAV
jgi:arylsulfatase A-like enzyme